jgi:hypothetical protein
MDLEQYRWQDRVIRSDWWVVELSVTLCAFAVLVAGSLIVERIGRDYHEIEPAGVSIPVMPEPRAVAQQHVAKRSAESTTTTRSPMRSAA